MVSWESESPVVRARYILAGFACWLALVAAGAGERVVDLNSSDYVNDFARVLDPGTEQQLHALCGEVDEKTGAQIAVVTVRSLGGRPIEDFAVDLFKRWGVGHKKNERGVLILLAVEDRKDRIEVGYGLEPILPD